MPGQSREQRMIRVVSVVAIIALGFWVISGSRAGRDPIPALVTQLAQYPEYSIIVDDVNDGFLRNSVTLQSSYRDQRTNRREPRRGGSGPVRGTDGHLFHLRQAGDSL